MPTVAGPRRCGRVSCSIRGRVRVRVRVNVKDGVRVGMGPNAQPSIMAWAAVLGLELQREGPERSAFRSGVGARWGGPSRKQARAELGGCISLGWGVESGCDHRSEER